MSNIEKYADLIDAYVQNRLIGQEKIDFENVVQQDIEIAREIDRLLKMKSSFERKDIHDFKKKLDMIRESTHKHLVEADSNIIPIKQKNWKLIWSAAAVLIVIIGSYIFLSNQQPNCKKIAMDALNDPYLESVRSGDESSLADSIKLALSDIIQAGNCSEFMNQAIVQEQNSEFVEQHGSWLHLYQAYCHLQSGSTELARKSLFNISDPTNDESGHRDYLLGLSYLIDDDKATAASILKASKAQFPWDSRITVLLAELD